METGVYRHQIISDYQFNRLISFYSCLILPFVSEELYLAIIIIYGTNNLSFAYTTKKAFLYICATTIHRNTTDVYNVINSH